MREQNNKTYRVLVSAAASREDFAAGKVLKLRYWVSAPSPTTAKTYVPGRAYRVDGTCRQAWTLPIVEVTTVKKEPEAKVPEGLMIVGADDVSALSLRVMASMQKVQPMEVSV